MEEEPHLLQLTRYIHLNPLRAGAVRDLAALILDKLGSGETIEAVLESHLRLTREGILAALRFAAQALRSEVVYPLPAKSA